MKNILKKIMKYVYGIELVMFQAYVQFQPLENVDQSSKLTNLYNSQGAGFGTYINRMFEFALTVGAILAVVRIAYGGYLYMGSEMWTSKGRAREVIRDAVVGLLLLLAIYLILYQINPEILNLNVLRGVSAAHP